MKLFLNVFIALLFLQSSTIFADALIVNKSMKAPVIAEFFIDESGVTAELEIALESLAEFKDLLPDDVYQQLGFGDELQQQREPRFFNQQLVLLDQSDAPLPAEVLSIGPSRKVLRDPVSGTPLPVQDEALDVIRATVRYDFLAGQLPSQLVFGVNGIKDVGFVAYHNQVAINDFRYLANGYRLNLDWQDPWYSSFNTRNLRRQYYAPMSGFIYVEPFEVRKEIVARPKDLQRWVDLGLKGKTTIPVDQQEAVKQKIAEFLAEHHPVTIDDSNRQGSLERINFLERTLTSSRVVNPPRELSLDSAIIGAIFVYPVSGLPQQVTMDWDMWDERIKQVPVSAVDQAGPLPSRLDPDWRVLKWENFLKNPVDLTPSTIESPQSNTRVWLAKSIWFSAPLLTLFFIWCIFALKKKQPVVLPVTISAFLLASCLVALLMGASNKADPLRAQSIVASLLHNIYRAFDYRVEEDIYDALERSVSGELLTDIYLETKRGLVLANQGGAQAKVNKVTLNELILQPLVTDDTFIVQANWTINGSVGHWGHVHQRTNRYQALLTIAISEQQWKLQEMLVLDEERL